MKDYWYPCNNFIQRMIYNLSTDTPYVIFLGSVLYLSIKEFSLGWLFFSVIFLIFSVLSSGLLYDLFASQISLEKFDSFEKGAIFRRFFKQLYYPLSPAKKMDIPTLERFIQKKKFTQDQSGLFYLRHFSHFFWWTLHRWFQPHFSHFTYRIFFLKTFDQFPKIEELNLKKDDNVFDIILISERASTYTENYEFSHFTIAVEFSEGGVKRILWNAISITSLSKNLDFFSKKILIFCRKKEFPLFLYSNSYQIFRFFHLYFMSF